MVIKSKKEENANLICGQAKNLNNKVPLEKVYADLCK